MNIKQIHNNNPAFGQIVPAGAIIKSALGTPTYEEAKALNFSLGVKYSGHISFHKRALKIAETACAKDKNFNEIIQKLKNLSAEKQTQEIKIITEKNNGQLDVLL